MEKRVFIIINAAGPAGNGKLGGIFRYLRRRMNWDIHLVRHPAAFTCDIVRQMTQEGFDGFILSIGEADEAKKLLLASDKPAVLMDFQRHLLNGRNRRNTIFIDNNSTAIGEAAADYLLGTGCCQSYAYVHFRLGGRNYEWDIFRGNAFAKRIMEHGFPCADVFALDELLTLKRPIGIMAANDETAYNVLRYCRQRRLQVPESVLLIGVDNDLLLCENAVPQLTSVLPDFEHEGYLAAQMLDQMMSGKRHTLDDILSVGIKTIVQRQSSRIVTHSGKMIQNALLYIRENALGGIDANSVADFLGWSRRLTDLRFREILGRTVGETIMERRLDEVSRLLTTTDMPIAKIAESCNYSNISHLNAIFKRRYNQTMQEYRHNAAMPGTKAKEDATCAAPPCDLKKRIQ